METLKDKAKNLSSEYYNLILGRNSFEVGVYSKKCAILNLSNTIQTLESIQDEIPDGKITIEQAKIFKIIQEKINDLEALIYELEH